MRHNDKQAIGAKYQAQRARWSLGRVVFALACLALAWQQPDHHLAYLGAGLVGLGVADVRTILTAWLPAKR